MMNFLNEEFFNDEADMEDNLSMFFLVFSECRIFMMSKKITVFCVWILLLSKIFSWSKNF